MIEQKILFGTGLSSAKDYSTLRNIIFECIDNRICAFDTAPSYQTEEVLGMILSNAMHERNIQRNNLWIQSKIDAWQMQESEGKVADYVLGALKKMRLSYFDAFLIHWPIPEFFGETYCAIQRLKQEGIILNVGVCNIRTRHLEKMLKDEIDLPDIVQLERNPLNTFSAEINFCRENKILVQDYSPLCKFCKDIAESDVLRTLSEKYKRSIGQIVLRWHIDTGASPIFTTQKNSRVREYSNIFDFELESEDINKINIMNQNYKMYLESVACPGF